MTRIFDFGKNWQAFSDHLADEQRLEIARSSLRDLLRRDNLAGASILDIGCGSGIFSLAAAQLEAARVVGIDINPRCIQVSERNLARFMPGAPVRFAQFSALDRAGLSTLGQFDIVYAWGSLHHTGAMWDAISNAAERVAPGGMLVLAIYNQHSTSPIWKRIKWLYNQLPMPGQQAMAVLFAGVIYVAKFAVTRRNPLAKERGMDFWYDVVDWVGGYPYEYAAPRIVKMRVEAEGFALRHFVPAQVPTGCNEFVFERVQ